MKTIILAGGWGTRLGHHTKKIPKPMVQIGNRPMLWHIMKYYSCFGYKDFIVSCGVKSEVIKKYFYDYEINMQDYFKDFSTGQTTILNNKLDIDWRVSVVDTGIHALKGARIKKLEKLLDGPTHMVTYGDGLSDINVAELVDFHNKHKKTITISGVKPPSRFGEIIEKNSKVLSFEEKPQVSVGLINGGFMVFNKNLLEYLTDDDHCDFEFNALEKLSAVGEVMVYKHQGNWSCVDHERHLVHLNKVWNENQAFWKIW